MDGRGVNGDGGDCACACDCECDCDGGFGVDGGLDRWRRDARSCSSVVVLVVSVLVEVVLALELLFGWPALSFCS